MSLLSIAESYTEAGLTVFAINGKTPNTPTLPWIQDDTSGKWKQSWKPFQTRQPTRDELRRMFTHHATTGLALACGPASKGRHNQGGLLAIDLDNLVWKEPYLQLLGDHAKVPLIQETGSGGLQLLQVCRGAAELRNQKLAFYPNPHYNNGLADSDGVIQQEWEIGIETRCDGGYACIAPSRHPNGRYYQTLQHAFEDMPFAEDETVLAELQVAQSFNQMPVKETHPDLQRLKPRERKQKYLSRPRLIMNAFTDAWGSLARFLAARGYDILSERRALRPGAKRGENMPGVLFTEDGEAAYFFSSNDYLHYGYQNAYGDPFHDTWGACVGLDYDGDFYEALEQEAKHFGIQYQRPDLLGMLTARAHPVNPAQWAILGANGQDYLFVVDTLEAARHMERQGVAALYVPKMAPGDGYLEAIQPWGKRYVLPSQHTGGSEALADMLGALIMEAPTGLTVPELTPADLYVMVKNARVSTWKMDARALRKKGV